MSCVLNDFRWPMVLFYNMLDISALNAYIIWIHLNPQWNTNKNERRRLFLKDLGRELIEEQMQSRLTIPGLSLKLRETIQQCLLKTTDDVEILENDCAGTAPLDDELNNDNDADDEEANNEQSLSKRHQRKRGRCTICSRGRDKKVRSVCAQCKSFVCEMHSSVLCKSCRKMS